jgi:ATP-dependent Clp protease ATP-binding subunit ClpX
MRKISVKWIIKELDKYVAGQEETKKAFAIAGYNHYLRLYHSGMNMTTVEPPRLTLLVSGPTGSGKTLLAETLCKILDFPILKIDASQLSNAGYVGNDLGDYLCTYIKAYKGTPLFDFIERGIIFIDEIDKLGQTGGEAGWKDTLQASLLTALDGTDFTLDSRDAPAGISSFNTRNCLFILGGAFETAYAKRGENKGIGFRSEVKNPDKADLTVYDKPLTRDELEKSGLRRELIGRISITTSVKPLTDEHIKQALTTVKDNVITQYESALSMSGVTETVMSEDDLNTLVKDISASQYGFRYAKAMLYDYYKDKLVEAPGIGDDTGKSNSLITTQMDGFGYDNVEDIEWDLTASQELNIEQMLEESWSMVEGDEEVKRKLVGQIDKRIHALNNVIARLKKSIDLDP